MPLCSANAPMLSAEVLREANKDAIEDAVVMDIYTNPIDPLTEPKLVKRVLYPR